jgi:hypothetical protein
MNKPQQTVKEVRILAWAVFWLVVIFGISEYTISSGWPWNISWIEPYMLRKKNDDWTHNAFTIQKIKDSSRAAEEETFVFIGGSIALEAISSDSIISRRINELSGKRVNFKSISATYQTFADNAKIMEELGPINGTLLIGIEPLSFKAKLSSQITEKLKTGHTHLKYYYLTAGPGTNSILSEYGFEGGPFHSLHLFKTAKVFGEILKKKAPVFLTSGYRAAQTTYSRHAVGDKTPVTEEKRKEQVKWLEALLKDYNKFHKMNLDLLGEIVNITLSNGNRVILIDIPDNPIYKEQISKFNDHYNDMVREFVAEKDVGYIDMRYAAEWEPEDYRDVHHMRSFGRKKFTEALARKLSDYLRTGSSLKTKI